MKYDNIYKLANQFKLAVISDAELKWLQTPQIKPTFVNTNKSDFSKEDRLVDMLCSGELDYTTNGLPQIIDLLDKRYYQTNNKAERKKLRAASDHFQRLQQLRNQRFKMQP